MIVELIPEQNTQDLELIIPAYLHLWNHEDNLPFLSLTGLPFQESQLREWLSKHISYGVRYFASLDMQDHVEGLIITKADPIIGIELFSLSIDPSHKRRGVGSSLVRHSLIIASQEGYQSIEGKVYANNGPMLCLLINFGFEPTSISYHVGPRGEDIVVLKKLLLNIAPE